MKRSLHDNWIDPEARKIVQVLQKNGFETYLVGGCVRDLLVGIPPKDFDIATNALPQDVRKKVYNSYIIGKRFRLVLVKRGSHQFEVATFRRNMRAEDLDESNPAITGDNYFGTSKEDAQRRDFTINALFYDPIKHDLIDYSHGLKDIESGVIRMIGEPRERLVEDPIRILRAIRLAHKLHFAVEEELRKAMLATASELIKSALPRKREEYLKILKLDEPWRVFTELYDLEILQHILPALKAVYDDPIKQAAFEKFLIAAKNSLLGSSEPVELFSGFMYAFMKAYYGEEAALDQLVESEEKLLHFMKMDLGMFNLEIMMFKKALQLIPQLQNRHAFVKKGARRQVAFMRNESFFLALSIGYMDYQLPTDDFHFWLAQIKRASQAKVDETNP